MYFKLQNAEIKIFIKPLFPFKISPIVPNSLTTSLTLYLKQLRKILTHLPQEHWDFKASRVWMALTDRVLRNKEEQIVKNYKPFRFYSSKPPRKRARTRVNHRKWPNATRMQNKPPRLTPKLHSKNYPPKNRQTVSESIYIIKWQKVYHYYL